MNYNIENQIRELSEYIKMNVKFEYNLINEFKLYKVINNFIRYYDVSLDDLNWMKSTSLKMFRDLLKVKY